MLKIYIDDIQLDRTGPRGEVLKLARDAEELLRLIREEFGADVSIEKTRLVCSTRQVAERLGTVTRRLPGVKAAVATVGVSVPEVTIFRQHFEGSGLFESFFF